MLPTGALFFEHRADVAAADASQRKQATAAREKAAADRREVGEEKAADAEA